jgi:hypothetical protein
MIFRSFNTGFQDKGGCVVPAYRGEAYQIKDNQFWYSKCSFAQQIGDKQFITIRITGAGERTMELKHSKPGRDSRVPFDDFEI